MAYDFDKRTSVADTITYNSIYGQTYENLITKERRIGRRRGGGKDIYFMGSTEPENGNDWRVVRDDE